MKWLIYLKKSKTLQFNMLVAVLAILELNMQVFQSMLGDHYGIVMMVVAMINAVLRVVTTTSLDDK